MPVVRANGIELSYERSGAGPPLLLIMGMSGTALHWGEPFLRALREDFDVIVYDHRGVGAARASRASAHDRADGPGRRRRCSSALELDSAHVLGISMGGMVAQELALRTPERVRTLTLGCTYCGGPGSALTRPGEDASGCRGDVLRRPRARAAHRLGDQRLAGVRRRRRRLRGVPRPSRAVAGGGARRDGPDAGLRGARHERAPARA